MKKAESLQSGPGKGYREQKSPLLSVPMSKVAVLRIPSILLSRKAVL